MIMLLICFELFCWLFGFCCGRVVVFRVGFGSLRVLCGFNSVAVVFVLVLCCFEVGLLYVLGVAVVVWV